MGRPQAGNGRRSRAALVAGLSALALIIGSVAAASGANPEPGAGAKAASKCKRAIVNGRRVCLQPGQRCSKPYQDDYVAAGFSCDRGRLRRATVAELRGPEPILVDENGQLSLKAALAAFDQGIANLPGVKVANGEIGNLGDASKVVGTLQTHLSQLSGKQRAVVEAFTTPAADAHVVPDSAPAARRRAATPEEIIVADQYIDSARRVMRSHGYALLRPVTVTFLDKDETIRGKKVAGYVPYDDVPPGKAATCNIFITSTGRKSPAAFKELLYAHELAHCAQHAFFTSQTQADRSPYWVVEGSADWLGGMAVAEQGHSVDGIDWDPWLDHPEIDLFKREYDAVGFFSMIQQAGVDGWSRIRDVLSASGGGSGPAYAAAIAGLPDIFYSRWGPGVVRDPPLGPEWDYTGPGITASKPQSATLANGARKAFTIAAHASTGAKLAVKADVVTIAADKDIRGLLRFEGEQRKLQKGAYCAKKGGCKCKTHTNLQLPQLGATTYFGFGDSKKARTVTFSGRSLKDYCEKPRPGPAPCTARPAARRDGASCPVPSAGIMVLGGTSSDNEQLVATFRIGDCTVGGGGFTAISTDGAWRLEVGITGFSGFEQMYDIPYGGPDPEVVVDGPGGPYSNTTWQPGGLPIAGAIAFDADGRTMGLGFIEFRNSSQSFAITAAGRMTCVYPDD
jgi:hypothetical protein